MSFVYVSVELDLRTSEFANDLESYTRLNKRAVKNKLILCCLQYSQLITQFHMNNVHNISSILE